MIFTRSLSLSKNYFRSFVHNYYTAYSSTLNVEKNNASNHIVWLDMEMTGLNINTSHILEIACIITDNDLNVVSEDLNIVIHQPDKVLENMSQWCKKYHKMSGLTDESRGSIISIQDAEEIVLKHLQNHIIEGTCPLAGSTVYMDRLFLQKYMPSVNNYLHYRLIDTSTVAELIKRWNLKVSELSKKNVHRALPDIKESIKQLQHYKQHLFNT